jgi:pilus assembly protein CpaE
MRSSGREPIEMADLSRWFRGNPEQGSSHQGSERVQCVGIVDGAIGGAERFASIAALFPDVKFEPIGPQWSERKDACLDVVIVGISSSSSEEVEATIKLLRTRTVTAKVLVTLRDADVTTTRRLVREGAADVLPTPVSEAALALSLERLLAAAAPASASGSRPGRLVAVLKAGGGVGATALSVQAAATLAKGGGGVCVADLDLQFGAAAIYLDLPDAVTVTDCLSSGASLLDTPFATALATHRTGVRLLAAPRDIVPLETLGPQEAEALLTALRRDFALTIIDLPTAWTVWTNYMLNVADHIVLVTHLSVPHVQAVKRQLRALAAQGLDGRPLTLVCNSLSPDQTQSVSVKAAERALGRDFDVVVPEDRRTMTAAINQGVELSAIRAGTKAEKAIADLARRIAEPVGAPSHGRR